LSSKVSVEMAICDHSTVIVTRQSGEGKVVIEIVSDCPNVAMLAESLKEAEMDDLTEWQGNRIIDLAGKSGLTLTCLVPTAIFNCAWVELGMISKRLAMAKSPLSIHFVE
jgi:hypothetical protein